MQGVLVVQDVLTSSPGPLNPLFEGVVYIGWAWYILDGRGIYWMGGVKEVHQ